MVSVAPRVADAHPLHTTMTEVAYDGRTRTVQATIRVFADDFAKAVTASRIAGADPGGAYVARAFAITGPDGRAVPLRVSGTRRTGDLLWITLRGAAPAGIRGGTVRNQMLCALFTDQVNILRATYGGAPRSMLFVPGDGAKRIE
jgi:hypothetical protein